MATSKDFKRAFILLEGDIKTSISDLMENKHKIASLNIDEDIRIEHEISYYSCGNGWQGEGVAKIETAPNGSFILSNEYGEVLEEDGILADEWINILQMVEEQLERNSTPRYYPVVNQYDITERQCFGYGDIQNIDECESFSTLQDAKREVLQRMSNEGRYGKLVNLPVHTIYERRGNEYKPVSVAVAKHHAYLLGADANDVQDALFCDGFKTFVNIL